MAYLLILIGLVLLTVGSNFLVSGSVAIARRLGLSNMVIGLTLVGFGTSAPELSASLGAALAGSPGISVGNVVGSNIANILLILGIAALLKPIAIDMVALRRDSLVLLAATLLLILLGIMGAVPRAAGFAMVVAIIAYVGWTLHMERAANGGRSEESVYAHEADVIVPPQQRSPWIAGGAVLAGLAGLVYGADLLVTGAIEIARAWGVTEAIIGLTIVAVGTSLPELATSVTAALKGETDVAFGNVVGSNIFNSLFILGATASILPIPYPPSIAVFDNWVMLAATLALLLFAVTSRRISRIEGGLLLAGYAAYIGWIASL